MNTITLIGILCLVELCTGTISPPTGKSKKGKTNNKVETMKKISSMHKLLYTYMYIINIHI